MVGPGSRPQNYRERWLSEGSAQYAAALWIRKSRGENAFRAVLKRLADWTVRNAAAGPITLSYRIGHLRGDPQAYRAIVYDKGAYVLHMLRGLVGEDRSGGRSRASRPDTATRRPGPRSSERLSRPRADGTCDPTFKPG